MESMFVLPSEEAAEGGEETEKAGLEYAPTPSDETHGRPSGAAAPQPSAPTLVPDGSAPPTAPAAPGAAGSGDADALLIQRYKDLRPEQCSLLCYFEQPEHIHLLCDLLEKAQKIKDVVLMGCTLVDKYNLPHDFMRDIDYFNAIRPFCRSVQSGFNHRNFLYHYNKFVDDRGYIHLPYQNNGKSFAKAASLTSLPAASDSGLPLPDRPLHRK